MEQKFVMISLIMIMWAEHYNRLELLTLFEIKQIVKKIGSNRRVLNKKVLMDVVPPFDLVSKYGMGRGFRTDGAGIGGSGNKKDNLLNQQAVLSCRKFLTENRTIFQQKIHEKL